MNSTKNSRTTPNKKDSCGLSFQARKQKENFYLKDEFNSYLQSKNLAPSSIAHYVRELGLFLSWIRKEEIQITKPDVLKYLEYLNKKRNLENISRARVLNVLNHYFTFLLKKEEIASNPCSLLKIRGTKKESLYRIYSTEELQILYDNFYHFFVRGYDNTKIPMNQRKQSDLSKQRNAVILNILINQGTTTKEIDKIEFSDLDLAKATLKIHGGRKSSERVLSLEATQIGVLTDYLQNIRPQFLEYQEEESTKLFLPLPAFSKKTTELDTVMGVFKLLTKQVKMLDAKFVNFKQIRASVLTKWLTVYGVRKTQIMAGHKHILTTEKYKVNDLKQLTEDINQLHLF